MCPLGTSGNLTEIFKPESRWPSRSRRSDPGSVAFDGLRRITLPMISPSLRAGLVLAWARALGEFGATVTFAGNLQGRTQTLPLAVFVALEQDRDTAVAISLVLVAVSLAVLLLLRDRWWSNGSTS